MRKSIRLRVGVNETEFSFFFFFLKAFSFLLNLFIWEPFFTFIFLSFMREVVSCCKGEWKAIQEKSFSKSENEGLIIQKTQSLKSVFRTTTFFYSYSPFYPHFYIYYSYVPLIFLIQIFILFIFTSITIHQRREQERERERELRKQNVGNGGWWVSKLLFGGDSGVCQFDNSNGQWWFQMPIWYCMWEE